MPGSPTQKMSCIWLHIKLAREYVYMCSSYNYFPLDLVYMMMLPLAPEWANPGLFFANSFYKRPWHWVFWHKPLGFIDLQQSWNGIGLERWPVVCNAGDAVFLHELRQLHALARCRDNKNFLGCRFGEWPLCIGLASFPKGWAWEAKHKFASDSGLHNVQCTRLTILSGISFEYNPI